MPEKSLPSKNFRIEFAKVVDRLEPQIKEYLREKGVEIKACRRVVDEFPNQKPTAMGCYSIKEKCIYIAEEVKRGNSWIKNFDVDFNLRHESGHAFSYTFRDYEQLSSSAKFAKTFADEAKQVPKEVFRTLNFEVDTLKGIEYSREEVFADSFAHATGCKTYNYYSKLIREYFPNCRKYFGGK